MSWTRTHIEELAELQLRTQALIASAGTDAPGIDWLVEVNECLVNAQGHALLHIEYLPPLNIIVPEGWKDEETRI